MRVRLGAAVCVVAGSAMVGACADAPDPVAPSAPIQTPRLTPDQVAGWFAQASPVVLAHPRAVFTDHDEARGLLVVGVEDAQTEASVRASLVELGVPEDAYVIERAEPIYQVATLRDRWRPTQGGIQIHFGNFLCTLGFNADDGTQRSFITNSHCTNTQGGVESTQYRQPTSTVDPAVIATEVEDPTYFRGSGCPFLRRCRRSDAARALYSSGTGSTRGVIARTSAPNNGSLEVTGTFTITSQDNSTTSFPIGTTVNKVGRTTGWTQGNVVQTCANVNVSGTLITQLCQTLVQNPGGAVVVGGGDSGSNVFRITSGNNVQLVGILWGGNSNGTLFVFSPLSAIRGELGPIVATN